MTPSAPDLPERLDALKAILEAQLDSLRTLSERSFTTTLQAITLNVAIVAGLIASEVQLSTSGKWVATSLIFVFTTLVVCYLLSKYRAHHRERVKFNVVQAAITRIAGVDLPGSAVRSFWRSFLGGSGLFAASVLLAGICAVVAVWIQLLAPSAP